MSGMLEIKEFTFGWFQTNTYVIHNAQGQVWIVDPACQTPAEQNTLLCYLHSLPHGEGPQEVKLLATHGHLDHLWGAAWACRQFGQPVQMHEADRPMAEAMQAQYQLFGIPSRPEPFPIAPLDLSGSVWSVLHTPGHTPGSVCLYCPEERLLLSGDTLFENGYGRTDLPGGDFRQLIQSLKRLTELPPETRVLPGHGNHTTIGACR